MKTHIFGRRQTIADNAPVIDTCCRTCGKREICKGVPDFPVCDRRGECTATDRECNADCTEWVKQEDGEHG